MIVATQTRPQTAGNGPLAGFSLFWGNRHAKPLKRPAATLDASDVTPFGQNKTHGFAVGEVPVMPTPTPRGSRPFDMTGFIWWTLIRSASEATPYLLLRR